MPEQKSTSVERVKDLRLWVERCDDMGHMFMSSRDDSSTSEGGLYVFCSQHGTRYYFAGASVDFRSLNSAIAENIRDEFEVVVTGVVGTEVPDALEVLTDTHLHQVTDGVGKRVNPRWSEEELERVRSNHRPIRFIRAESLTVNL